MLGKLTMEIFYHSNEENYKWTKKILKSLEG